MTRASPTPRRSGPLFDDAGVAIAGVATGLRFDQQIFPPVLGRALGSFDAPVAEAKPCVDLASDIGAGTVRVFGYDAAVKSERARGRYRKLMIDRLRQVAAAARHMGVRVLVENGGMFPAAADLASLVDDIGSTHLAASYALHANGGEDPERAVETLGWRLEVARIKDYKGDRPCRLGEGDLACRPFIEAVAALERRSPAGRWLVFDWDKAWLRDLEGAESVLPAAASYMFDALAPSRGVTAAG